MQHDDPALEGLFCDACGRDANDVADEDFYVPKPGADEAGFLSGRCQRHPPEGNEKGRFDVVHIGGASEDGLGEA